METVKTSMLKMHTAVKKDVGTSTDFSFNFNSGIFIEPPQLDPLTNNFQQLYTSEMPIKPSYQVRSTASNANSSSTCNAIEQQRTQMLPMDVQNMYQDNETRSVLLPGLQRISTPIIPSLAAFACHTVTNSISEGMRDSTMCQLFSKIRVPDIVINSAPDEKGPMDGDCKALSENDPFDQRMFSQSLSLKIGASKYLDRHRSKNYYRPYCIINRKQYNCRTFSPRMRKYGVSHRGTKSAPVGVNELTELLDKMVTKEVTKPTPGEVNGKKWQYSPPPKYYTVRKKPLVTLAEIKERSRSLNDLNIQDANKKVSNDVFSQDNGGVSCSPLGKCTRQRFQGTSDSGFGNTEDRSTADQGSYLSSNPVGNIVSQFDKLDMS